MRTVNIGVVGTGFMGVTHIKSYLKIPGARLGAVCDPRLPANGDLSGIGGNVGDGKPLQLDMTQVKAYSKFEDLLANPEIDLIDLCVPTAQHPQLATAALRAGKHVICEKPLARTPALCREIVDVAAKSKGFFMPAMVMRFWPEWAWLKKAIDEKTYGKVLAARFRRVCAPPGWSKANYFKGDDSGGALLDLHIHDTHFIGLVCGVPQQVFSTGIEEGGAVQYLTTSYLFGPGGPAVTCASGAVAQKGRPFVHGFEIYLEKATLVFESGTAPLTVLTADGKAKTPKFRGGEDPLSGFTSEIQAAVDGIAFGRLPELLSGQLARDALVMCHKEIQSARSGKPVRVA